MKDDTLHYIYFTLSKVLPSTNALMYPVSSRAQCGVIHLAQENVLLMEAFHFHLHISNVT